MHIIKYSTIGVNNNIARVFESNIFQLYAFFYCLNRKKTETKSLKKILKKESAASS